MADVYVNALTTISTEPGTTDSVVCVNRNTNEGQIIDYNLLADKILDKLTSKQYSALTTTSKLITGAINELDSDVASLNSSKDSILSKLNNYVKVKQFEVQHVSIAAGASSWPTMPSIAETGYEPIGIVGYYISGAPASAIIPYSQRIASGNLSIALKNVGTADSPDTLMQFQVLYRKTT